MNYYERAEAVADSIARVTTGSKFIGGCSGISLAACLADFGLVDAHPADLAAAWLAAAAAGDYAPLEALAYGSGGQS